MKETIKEIEMFLTADGEIFRYEEEAKIYIQAKNTLIDMLEEEKIKCDKIPLCDEEYIMCMIDRFTNEISNYIASLKNSIERPKGNKNENI